MLVTDAAAQPPRQATAWLIMTLGRIMKTQLSPHFDAKRRFLIVFWASLAVFTLGYVISLFTNAPSNVIYGGVEVTGYARFVVNLFFIPLCSLFLGALSLLPEYLWSIIRNRIKNEK